MSGVLDPLRLRLDAMLEDELGPQWLSDPVTHATRAIVDEFQSLHPGLVDNTMHCYTCAKPMWDTYCEWAHEVGGVVVFCDECQAAAREQIR
jgi:hypothetical protein